MENRAAGGPASFLRSVLLAAACRILPRPVDGSAGRALGRRACRSPGTLRRQVPGEPHHRDWVLAGPPVPGPWHRHRHAPGHRRLRLRPPGRAARDLGSLQRQCGISVGEQEGWLYRERSGHLGPRREARSAPALPAIARQPDSLRAPADGQWPRRLPPLHGLEWRGLWAMNLLTSQLNVLTVARIMSFSGLA